jgi:predicted nucleotidyltransferase
MWYTEARVTGGTTKGVLHAWHSPPGGGRGALRHDQGRAMKTKEAIRAFRKEIEKLYGKRLRDMILYGSWARGGATEDSDIDLLIVLDGKVVPGQEIDRMIDIITEINLEHGVLISVYPVAEESYATVNSPLFINVRREGVSM